MQTLGKAVNVSRGSKGTSEKKGETYGQIPIGAHSMEKVKKVGKEAGEGGAGRRELIISGVSSVSKKASRTTEEKEKNLQERGFA